MKICVCCGGRMNVCSPRNPNICVDCETLTFDDSPATLAEQTEAKSAPEESAGHTEQGEVGEAFPVPQWHAASNSSRPCNTPTDFL